MAAPSGRYEPPGAPRGGKNIYYKVQMNESGNKMWENKNKEGYPRMGVTSHIHGALIEEFERSRRAAAAASGSTRWLTPSMRSGSMRLDLHGNTQGHASPCLVRGRVEPLCVSVCVRVYACPMHGNYRRCSLITTKTLEFESKAFRGKQAAVFNDRRHTSKVPNRRKDRIKWLKYLTGHFVRYTLQQLHTLNITSSAETPQCQTHTHVI